MSRYLQCGCGCDVHYHRDEIMTPPKGMPLKYPIKLHRVWIGCIERWNDSKKKVKRIKPKPPMFVTREVA